MEKKREKKYIKLVKRLLKNLQNLRIRRYSHKFSKKMYGNWTHIVLLVLRQRIDKSYREFVAILDVCTEILNVLGIAQAPHFTTLQKAAKRLRVAFLEKIMSGFVLLTMVIQVRTGIDATGFQLTRASAHYATVLKKNRKARRKIRKYLKLTMFVDLGNQLIISQKIRRSPRHDTIDFKPAVYKGKAVLDREAKVVRSFDGDKGYDSEENRRVVVEELGAEDRIKIRNKDVPIHRTKGRYRKRYKRRCRRLRANYRSKNESTISALKRIEGSTIRSISVGMQNKEMLFKEIAYNAGRFIDPLLFLEDFY